MLSLLDVHQLNLPLQLLHVRWRILDPAQLLMLKEALFKREAGASWWRRGAGAHAGRPLGTDDGSGAQRGGCGRFQRVVLPAVLGRARFLENNAAAPAWHRCAGQWLGPHWRPPGYLQQRRRRWRRLRRRRRRPRGRRAVPSVLGRRPPAHQQRLPSVWQVGAAPSRGASAVAAANARRAKAPPPLSRAAALPTSARTTPPATVAPGRASCSAAASALGLGTSPACRRTTAGGRARCAQGAQRRRA